jgi:hypothetical protein
MVWAGHLEKLVDVIGRSSCLMLEIALSDSDVFLRVIYHHVIVIVIIITASRNCDPLGGEPLLPLLTALGTSLSAFADNLQWCPLIASGDHLPVALDKDGPAHLFTRGVPGGYVQ